MTEVTKEAIASEVQFVADTLEKKNKRDHFTKGEQAKIILGILTLIGVLGGAWMTTMVQGQNKTIETLEKLNATLVRSQLDLGEIRSVNTVQDGKIDLLKTQLTDIKSSVDAIAKTFGIKK